MDQRKATKLPKLSFYWRLLFSILRLNRIVKHFTQDVELNWLKQYQPEILENTEHFVLLSGYLNYKLTDQFNDSIGNQVAYIPFDYKRHKWAKLWDWKSQSCPIAHHKLPTLVPVGERLGEISDRASRLTGLPQGLPVIAAAADKACETLGCGAIQSHQGQISYGTTATYNWLTKRYVEPTRYSPAFPSALPHTYSCEFQIYRGFWMVSWFKQQFGHSEHQEAILNDETVESILDKRAGDIPPGSDGLLLQPYWSPGLTNPGPEARGAIIGFTDKHTKAHIYRAMLEGIAFALHQGRKHLEKRSGKKISEIYVSGGGAQSHTALQLTADIFNLPVKLPKTHETSGLGAAINCAVGLGMHSDYQAAVNEMCETSEVIEPIEDNVRLYESIFRNVYQPMYSRLKPLYHSLYDLFYKV
jgi:sugar (pentulose or hexulose) kinase